jgi:pimeloyl-ACP methyl ester carboxylesterase
MMFQPPGFCQRAVQTQLGRMVYYTNEELPWIAATAANISNLETLVFLHGFGGGSSAYEWSKVYPAFAANFHIVAPDLVGWGASEHPARNYQVDDYLNSIGEFIENISDSPVTAIASSLTAAFLVQVAIARPHLFKSLILVAPSGLSDFGENYNRSFFAQLVSTPVVDRVLYNVAIANPAGIRSFLEQRQFAQSKRIYPEIVDAYLKSAQQPNADYAALSFVRGDLCFDLSRYIDQLKIPTAILWGEKTQFTTITTGRRLAALNSQAIKVFHEIKDAGLTPQLELPAVMTGLIYNCLATLNATKL